MTAALTRHTWFISGLLLVSWAAIWGAWIFAPSVSLRLNAFTLSEWATFLNDARYGDLRIVPDVMRLALALAPVTFAISARWLPSRYWQWGMRLLVVPIILLLLPPYPDFFQLWMSPSYGGRFLTMTIAAGGLVTSFFADRLTEKAVKIVVTGLCLVTLGCAIYSFAALLGPFQAHFARPLYPGWAFIVFCCGLVGAVGLSIASIVRDKM
jgi:hypothetical protein